MFYINRQGGARASSLCQEAVHLWDYCIAQSIHLEPSYLLGSQNKLVDCLCRLFINHHEWSIHPDVLGTIFQKWGFPQLDLFAPRYNRKYPQFGLYLGRSSRSLTDAFLLPWGGGLMYAFPPMALIHRVLLKVRRDKARILIAPVWPWQHWFSILPHLRGHAHQLLLLPDLIS